MADDTQTADATATTTETTAATATADTTATQQTQATATQTAKPTITATTEANDAPVATPADWPEDWRERLAGEDKAFLNQLKRYASPASYAKAGFEAQQKIRSGEYKRPLPADANDEDKAAWRKENGLPEKPEGYLEKLALPNGMVLGEADKPLAGTFAAAAHEANMTPEQFSRAMAWYYETVDKQQAAAEEADAKFHDDGVEALRSEWGREYRSNVNAIQNLLASAPEGVADRLAGGRTADGRRIGDDPAILRWLAGLSREMNPAATLVPAGADATKHVGDRINEIKAMMADQSSAYWTGPQSAGLQAEYRELVDAQLKMKDRAAA